MALSSSAVAAVLSEFPAISSATFPRFAFETFSASTTA